MIITRDDLFAYVGRRCSPEKSELIRASLKDPESAASRFFAGLQDDMDQGNKQPSLEELLPLLSDPAKAVPQLVASVDGIVEVMQDMLLLGLRGEHLKDLQCARNALLHADSDAARRHIYWFCNVLRECIRTLEKLPVTGEVVFEGGSEDSDSDERPATRQKEPYISKKPTKVPRRERPIAKVARPKPSKFIFVGGSEDSDSEERPSVPWYSDRTGASPYESRSYEDNAVSQLLVVEPPDMEESADQVDDVNNARRLYTRSGGNSKQDLYGRRQRDFLTDVTEFDGEDPEVHPGAPYCNRSA